MRWCQTTGAAHRPPRLHYIARGTACSGQFFVLTMVPRLAFLLSRESVMEAIGGYFATCCHNTNL